jgi:hypothetical protein
MPAKKSDSPTGPLHLTEPRVAAKEKLEQRIDLGRTLLARPLDAPAALEAAKTAYYDWSNYNTQLLEVLFTDTREADRYKQFFGCAGRLAYPFQQCPWERGLSPGGVAAEAAVTWRPSRGWRGTNAPRA